MTSQDLGTFNCPLCGKNIPHFHFKEYVDITNENIKAGLIPFKHCNDPNIHEIERLRAELIELQAKYAGVVEAVEDNQWIVGETGGEICPECGGMRRIGGHEDYCSISKVLASTPQSVLGLLAVLEAANTALEAGGVFTIELGNAIRAFKGEKTEEPTGGYKGNWNFHT